MAIAAAAIIQAIPALIKLGSGISQSIKAKKLEKEAGDRPEYEIPESIQQMLDKSNALAQMRELPGANIMEERIRGTTSEMASRMQEATAGTGAMLGGLAQLGRQEAAGLQDIGVRGAEFWSQNQQQLMSNLARMGQYEQEQWKQNMLEPYMESKYAEAALRGAGMQNIFGAATDIAGAGSQGMFWSKMLGEQGATGATGVTGATGATQFMSEQSPELNMGEIGDEYLQENTWYNPITQTPEEILGEEEKSNTWQQFKNWFGGFRDRKFLRDFERDFPAVSYNSGRDYNLRNYGIGGGLPNNNTSLFG